LNENGKKESKNRGHRLALPKQPLGASLQQWALLGATAWW